MGDPESAFKLLSNHLVFNPYNALSKILISFKEIFILTRKQGYINRSRPIFGFQDRRHIIITSLIK